MDTQRVRAAAAKLKPHKPKWRKEGLAGDIEALLHAWHGIKLAVAGRKATESEPAVKPERPVQIQLGVTALVLAWAFKRRLPPERLAVVALSAGSVIGAELQNAALEKVADKINGHYDPVIRDIKDQSAGAVFLRGAGAVAAILAVFWPLRRR